MEDKKPICGASVFFPADRYYIRRGQPLPAYIYAFGVMMDRAEKHSTIKMTDGCEVDMDNSRFFLESPRDDSKAFYYYHAEVKAIRRVKLSTAGEVLCIDLDVGTTALPCLLPVYVRESLIEGPPLEVGEVLEGTLFLQIDFFPPDEKSNEWLLAHPDGIDDDGDQRETSERSSYTISLAKRSENGKRLIPCGEGEPGQMVEVPDWAPTPESFDAVTSAFNRLDASFGCEDVVLWESGPDGINMAARVASRHGDERPGCR